jgi:hypothetical protein
MLASPRAGGKHGGDETFVEFGKMPRPGLAYERPSRVSQVLILSFSIAVLVMGGWLAMMIMLPHDADTVAADSPDVPAMATRPAPRVENSVTAYDPPLANGPQWPDAPPANPYSPPSAASPSPARPSGAYATSSLASNDNLPSDAGNDALESVPLPPPRPRRTAVPVPRPRPHIDDQAEVQPKERSLFDLLVGR